VKSFKSRESNQNTNHPNFDPIELASAWGIDKVLWRREWQTLSGGEGQRIALAIGVGLGGAEVVLLDGMSLTSSRVGFKSEERKDVKDGMDINGELEADDGS